PRPPPTLFPYTTLFRSGGEARQRLIELCTTQLAHQCQNRSNLRLPRCAILDSSFAVEQFQRLPQLRPQVTEMIIPADLLVRRGLDRKSTRLNSSHQIIS